MFRKVYFKVAVVFYFFISFGVACTQKALPVITSRNTEPFKKEKSAITMTPDLIAGKTIFENRCDKCHNLPKPEQFTAQRWEGILSYMIPRARLNDEQGIHVKAYLEANSLK